MSQDKVRITGFDESARLDNDERDVTSHIHFWEGVPRENAVDNARLAERASLQGAGSGLLHERVAIDAVEDEF